MSGPVWRKKAPAPAPAPAAAAGKLRAPIWQPDKSRAFFQLACPQCEDTHVRVHQAAVEVGGLENGSSEGRVVMYCNGHADSVCKHRFVVVISFHDAGVQCQITPHISPFALTQPQSTAHGA